MYARFAFAALAALTLISVSVVNGANLKTICDNEPLPLVRVSETKQLLEEAVWDQSQTCLPYKDSMGELYQLLTVLEEGKICNMDMVQMIRDYHMNFIKKGSAKPIPITLKNFFVSLCFQISAECKMALINNLEIDTKEHIKEEDYAQIQFLENYGATLLDFNEEISDFDDIVLLSDFMNAGGQQKQPGDQTRIIVKAKTNNMMRELVKNCDTKFKPFYDKLIMPLIHLSNMGYNYQGELLERELEELKHNKLVRRWYNILQTCEAFRAIEIYEDSEGTEQVGGDKQVLTFISQDEAEILQQKNVKTIEDEVKAIEDKPIDYEPSSWHNNDELWIKDQKELDKLVKKYKTNASESDRIRSKLMKKLLAKMKEVIMSGKIHLVASELLNVNRRSGACETEEVDVKQDLIMMMDEAIVEDEQEQMIQKGQEPLDQAVAGGAKRRPNGVRPIGVPARAKYVPKRVDGTKMSTKLYNQTLGRFLPNKLDLFFGFLGIISLLLITMGLILLIAG